MDRRVVILIGLLLFIFLLLVGAMPWWLSTTFHRHPQVDLVSGLYGALVGAAFTILLAWLAWAQLKSLAETAKQDSKRAHSDSKRASASFILQLKNDFFKEPTRTLINLVDSGWIEYVDKTEKGVKLEEPFFRVDEDTVKKSGLHEDVQRLLLARTAYSSYEIDDHLLGHFADLIMLRDEGVLTMSMIYSMFSWYIERTWENLEIKRYIDDEQAEDPTVYDGFKALYDECKKRENAN